MRSFKFPTLTRTVCDTCTCHIANCFLSEVRADQTANCDFCGRNDRSARMALAGVTYVTTTSIYNPPHNIPEGALIDAKMDGLFPDGCTDRVLLSNEYGPYHLNLVSLESWVERGVLVAV